MSHHMNSLMVEVNLARIFKTHDRFAKQRDNDGVEWLLCSCGERIEFVIHSAPEAYRLHIAAKTLESLKSLHRSIWDEGYEAAVNRPLYGSAERNPY